MRKRLGPRDRLEMRRQAAIRRVAPYLFTEDKFYVGGSRDTNTLMLHRMGEGRTLFHIDSKLTNIEHIRLRGYRMMNAAEAIHFIKTGEMP